MIFGCTRREGETKSRRITWNSEYVPKLADRGDDDGIVIVILVYFWAKTWTTSQQCFCFQRAVLEAIFGFLICVVLDPLTLSFKALVTTMKSITSINGNLFVTANKDSMCRNSARSSLAIPLSSRLRIARNVSSNESFKISRNNQSFCQLGAVE